MTTLEVAYNTLQETARHNIAMEGETKRHDLVWEGQNQQQIDESVRHNKQWEQLTQQQIDETIRHDQQSEMIGFAQAQAQFLRASAANRQADAALMNAQTNFMTYGLNSSIQGRLATVAEQNAKTNAMNAQTARAGMRINKGYLDLASLNYQTSTKFGLFDRVTGMIKDVIPLLPQAESSRKVGF
jgi:hypothetical protein